LLINDNELKNTNGKGSKKLEESEPGSVKGIDYKVGAVYANHDEKITKFNYM
jgi:hypothetical protein